MDASNIGQGRAFPEAVNAYDAKAGRYMDKVAAVPTEAKLPTQQLPMAPAPAPFVLKGSAGGER